MIPKAASNHVVHFRQNNSVWESMGVLRLSHGKYEPAMKM